MAKLTMHFSTEGTPKTVSEIRKELARALSKLNGGSLMTYTFTARIEEYEAGPSKASTPTPYRYPKPEIQHGPLADPSNE